MTLSKIVLGIGVVILFLAGCSQVDNNETLSQIVIGQTMVPKSLDPAATYSSSDFEVMYQIYPTVLNTLPSDPTLRGDVAAEFGYISPTEFQVKIREGLQFSNGNPLTASDVAFSFNRLLVTEEAGGPQALLTNVAGARLIDENTVIYDVKVAYDQSFPFILSSVPGLIVDEEVFPSKSSLSIEEIISASPFAGPYVLSAFEANELLVLEPNPTYQGLWGVPQNTGVIVRYFEDPKNMLLSLENGELDVATLFRSASADQAKGLAEKGDLQLVSGKGAEPGFLSFNLHTQPFGDATQDADNEKALAVRQAVASLIDRQEISELAYLGTYQPAFSTVPSTMPGHRPSFQILHPQKDSEAVAQNLEDLGIETPISLEIIFTPERYGENAAKVPFLLENQLERGGVFDIELKPLEWGTLREVRKTDEYQAVLLFWGPDFGEADNYLTPLYSSDGWLFNHFSNSELGRLLKKQLSESDVEKRNQILKEIQDIAAEQAPLIPLLEGGRSALLQQGISGVSETFDASFKFRYSSIKKSR